jgi:hypothetical protein
MVHPEVVEPVNPDSPLDALPLVPEPTRSLIAEARALRRRAAKARAALRQELSISLRLRQLTGRRERDGA